jgi:hypothetical protein
MKVHAESGSTRRQQHVPQRVSSEAGKNRVIDVGGRQTLIATAAYYRAQARGFEAGHELEDWVAAERDVDLALVAERVADQGLEA